jgi:hypothetical protein
MLFLPGTGPVGPGGRCCPPGNGDHARSDTQTERFPQPRSRHARTPTAALASTGGADSGIAAARARAISQINLRLVVLRGDAFAVNHAKHLSSTDRSTLAGVITKDATGLTALRTTIAGETSRKQLATDAATLFTGYRVFLLLQPQIRDVVAADSLAAGAQQVTANAASLTSSLTAAGTLTSAESADLATATSDAAAAVSAINGEVAALVALTPDMVVKPTLHLPQLTTARNDDKAAHAQLVAARAALAAARALAKAGTSTPPAASV